MSGGGFRVVPFLLLCLLLPLPSNSISHAFRFRRLRSASGFVVWTSGIDDVISGGDCSPLPSGAAAKMGGGVLKF